MKSVVVVFSLLFWLLILGACQNDNSQNSPAPTGADQPESGEARSTEWQNGFPTHWWKPVPKEEAKGWEVLPQDAGYKEVVLSKRNELGLLSNFTETPFVYRGVCYPTVEAYWQMMKYPENPDDPRWKWARQWKYTREQVSQMNGYSAKSAGGYANFLMEKNNANWVTFEGTVLPFVVAKPAEHYNLIWSAFIEKLRQNPEVLKVLLETKDLKFLPDHEVSENSPREWHYNLLWMDIRKLVQDGKLDLKTNEDLALRTCKALRF